MAEPSARGAGPESWLLRHWPRAGLWRHRDFLHLWGAQSISAFGSRISRTALPIIAIVSIEASAAEIGLLSALSIAPGVLVGLLMGGTVDRRAKKRLLIATDLLRAALLLTVPLMAWLDLLGMAQLYLVAAGTGAASTLFQIADNAYLPALVGRAQLVEGNAKLETTEAVAEIGGPSLAGLLIELMTAPFTLLVDAATYLLSALLLRRIHATEPPHVAEAQRPTILKDLRAGLWAGFGTPLVRPLFLVAGLIAFTDGFFLALYMVFTIQTLGLSAGTVGLLISVGGIGALLGALVARPVLRWLPLGTALILLLAGGRLTGLLIPLAQGSGLLSLGALAAHQLLGDALMLAFTIHAMSLGQALLPQAVLGRAFGTLHMVSGVLLPTGALLAGWLATALDVRSAVWIGVIVALATPLLLLFSSVRGLRGMPEPLNHPQLS